MKAKPVFETKTKSIILGVLFLFFGCLLTTCTKEVKYGSIQGIVTNSSTNEPIHGVNISLSPTGLSAVTGSDGRYEFKDLEAGQYTVQAVKEGYETNTKSINIVAGNVSVGDMTLKPIITVGSILGVVTNSSTNEPIQGVNVTLNPTGLSVVTGSDGRYEFKDVEAGQYTLQGMKTGFESNTKSITVTAGNVSLGDMFLKPEIVDFKLNVEYLDFGTNFSQLSFKVINASTSLPINWSISESISWLTATPSSGNLSANQEVSVQVTIDRTMIEQSTTANISVEAAGKTVVLPINVTVSGVDGPILQLSENSLDFGTTINSMVFQVMNAGPAGTSLHWTCSNVNVDWLTITPTLGNTAGGSSTPVTATIDRTKIEGWVSTSITISGAGSSFSVTISAAEEGAGVAVLQLSETSLNFGETNVTKTFQVKNIGSAGTVLDWSIVDPGEDWLSINPMSGSTNSGSGTMVTVVVDRTKFHGSVNTTVLVNSSTNNASLTVTAVNKQPNLEVSTQMVNFGSVSTSQTLKIKNVGDEGTSMQWSLSAPTVNWLTASPLSGNLNAGSSKTITLTIDRSLITADVSTELVVTAGNQNATIAVTATTAQSEMEVSVTSVDFGTQSNNKSFTIKNIGEQGSTLHWSISNPGVEWLAINPQSGSLTSGQSKTINLTLDRTKFDGDVTTDLAISTGDQTATVTITASTPVYQLQVTPPTLDFGALSTTKTFTVKNNGETGSTMSWSLENITVDWLLATPVSGNLGSGQSATVTLTIDRTKFTGNVSTVLNIIAETQSASVSISASTAQANLSVTPTSVDFGKTSNTKTIVVKNIGDEGSLLNWSIPNPTVNWLIVSPASGSLQANATANVTLTIDRSMFDGDVSTTIHVMTGDQSVTVSVTASTAVYELLVTPQTLDFGTVSTTKTFTVKNNGEAGSNMAWSLGNIGVDWLTATPMSGSLGANQTATVTLTIDRTKFTGDVSTSLQITAGTQSATVTVSASTPVPAMTVSPTAVDFGTVSTTKQITISNTGESGSVLNWTIAQPSVAWLAVSAQSGSTNANNSTTVTLTIDRNAFVGVQSTSITITGAGNTVNVPITVDNTVLAVNGLIAYYTFDDGQVTDWGGNYNGINNGATSSTDTPSNQGLSMNFNGTSSYLQIPYLIFQSGTTWSYNVWFKTMGNGCTLLGSSNSYRIDINGSSKLYVFPYYMDWTSTNTVTSYLDNQWHMLTVTFDGSRYSIYFDGSLFEVSNNGRGWASFITYMTVGSDRSQTSYPRYFNGKMDNIRTYNRALTQAEITILYNSIQ